MAEIAFGIGANTSALLSGLSSAQAAIRAAAGRMSGAMAPLQSAVSQATAGMQRFSGVIGGLSFAAAAAGMRQTLGEIAALDDASEKTGASVEELSSMLNTLAPSGVSLDTITMAMGRLTKAMTNADDETKGAGEAFNLLGVETRDAAGNLRPVQDVLEDVARALDQYRDGSAKTALAQAIFGRGAAELLPMLKDLANTTREAATVTGDQAANAERAEKAINKLGREMAIMREELVNALVPGLNEFLSKLRSIAAISGNPIKWGQYLFGSASDINAEVARIEADITRMQGLIDGSIKPDGGKNQRSRTGGLLGQAIDALGGSPQESQAARDRLMQLQRDLVEAKAVQAAQRQAGVSTAQGPRTGRAMLFDNAGYGPAADKSDAPAPSGDRGAAADALAKRQQAALQGIEMQLAKERELSEVEQMRIRTTTGDYRDFSAAVKTRLMLAAGELDQQKQLEAAQKVAAEADAEYARAEAQRAADRVRDLVREQEELERLADRYKDLADPTRKYTKQIEDIRKLVAKGKLSRDEGLAAEFEVESGRQDQIDGNAIKPPDMSWTSTVEGGFRRLFDSIKEGSISARGVFQGAFSMMSDIATGALSKIATEWLANLVVGKVAAIQTAFADISASAARAGAAAFASTAAIPIVGPAMAPAAGAAAYTGAMSFTSGLAVASAADGYDIPAGVNPLTQLHEREMVLPAAIADPLREQLGGRGRSGGGDVHIHSPDARGVERLLLDNPRALMRSFRRLRSAGAR
jgi:hypothetical protein